MMHDALCSGAKHLRTRLLCPPERAQHNSARHRRRARRSRSRAGYRHRGVDRSRRARSGWRSESRGRSRGERQVYPTLAANDHEAEGSSWPPSHVRAIDTLPVEPVGTTPPSVPVIDEPPVGDSASPSQSVQERAAVITGPRSKRMRRILEEYPTMPPASPDMHDTRLQNSSLQLSPGQKRKPRG
ncbi:hypothetical protein BDZ89DRAFT_1165693 [Hymenopellis radicata]|nr:hypothetical protein BDZ89DRAFT_1165693 [Hymenopellis radicata]